jgi:hypothetical protein
MPWWQEQRYDGGSLGLEWQLVITQSGLGLRRQRSPVDKRHPQLTVPAESTGEGSGSVHWGGDVRRAGASRLRGGRWSPKMQIFVDKGWKPNFDDRWGTSKGLFPYFYHIFMILQKLFFYVAPSCSSCCDGPSDEKFPARCPGTS